MQQKTFCLFYSLSDWFIYANLQNAHKTIESTETTHTTAMYICCSEDNCNALQMTWKGQMIFTSFCFVYSLIRPMADGKHEIILEFFVHILSQTFNPFVSSFDQERLAIPPGEPIKAARVWSESRVIHTFIHSFIHSFSRRQLTVVGCLPIMRNITLFLLFIFSANFQRNYWFVFN
jgi:hypothetical protein